jgi:dienelactone hydrolase
MKKSYKTSIKITVILGFLVVSYFVLDAILFDGFQPKEINEHGFVGSYFAPENAENKPTVVLIGGGAWGDYWGNEFVKKDYVAFSLPYTGVAELPALAEEIPLEYFEKALEWLQNQKEVDSSKIIVMGASRNAELALLLAATFPALIQGVIAYSPSSVSWANTVLPYNSDVIKASWQLKGKDIPFIPMEKLKGNESDTLETLSYWMAGLSKKDFRDKASIPVENINGAILLFSGKQDEVWPAVFMANAIENRLKSHEFQFKCDNIQYENAGHLIATKPETKYNMETGSMFIGEKEYAFKYGGTAEGDWNAKQDAKQKVFDFLANL